MPIDKSGDFWTGSHAADIEPFLKALAKEERTIPINLYRAAACGCGAVEFKLSGDDEEGCARRVCAACKTSHFICDSADYWQESTPEPLLCHGCAGAMFNVGAGFSLNKGEGRHVQWITIGQRCVRCGILGSFVDWKIGYSPSSHLIDQV